MAMHSFIRINGELRLVHPLTKPSTKNPFVLVKVRAGGLTTVHATQILKSY